MGIYDREYYRQDGRYWSALTATGQVCKWITIITVLVYVVQLLLTQPKQVSYLEQWFAAQPAAIFHNGEVWRLLTALFLHATGDIWHIIWNMLFLWFFGRDLEDLYGSREVLAFYLAAGVFGNAFWAFTTLLAGQPLVYCLGASTSVTAVMVLCACHFPNKTILLFLVIPIPIWLLTVIYVGLDAFAFLGGAGRQGVAVAAHLGGAGFGFLYYKMQWNIVGAWRRLGSLLRRSPSRPRLRVYREDEEPSPVGVGAARPVTADEQLEAKADAILAKLSQQGKESLTPDEWDVLHRASEQYKKKRT
jgi:membrane associated rhomboid family serine protease